jgi:hypothetical protein
MFYKLFQEQGQYIDGNGNECNLIECNSALTPEGMNIGWDEFKDLQTAISNYGIKLKEVNNIKS